MASSRPSRRCGFRVRIALALALMGPGRIPLEGARLEREARRIGSRPRILRRCLEGKRVSAPAAARVLAAAGVA